MNEDSSDEALREIKRLRAVVRELSEQLESGRNYLMTAQPDTVDISDALEAFGFGRDGLKEW